KGGYYVKSTFSSFISCYVIPSLNTCLECCLAQKSQTPERRHRRVGLMNEKITSTNLICPSPRPVYVSVCTYTPVRS
uniref:Uncharacterized protein n=1 Tax=Neogobius melanostomus TaxID=47308 RepID=A0A8C6UXX2_9GOBI